MKLLRWLDANHNALQAIAAIIILFTALAATPTLIGKVFRSDLVLQVDIDRSALPPDLNAWIRDLNFNLATLDTLFPKEDEKDTRILKFYDLRSSVTGKRLSERPFALDRLGRLRMDISNQTDSPISNVRVRVDNISWIWDVHIQGNFLTDTEAKITLIKSHLGKILVLLFYQNCRPFLQTALSKYYYMGPLRVLIHSCLLQGLHLG